MLNETTARTSPERYTQDGRTIRIDSPLGPDVLLLTSVAGEDAISRCFVYQVEFITQASDDAVRSLIGRSVTIWLQNHLADDRQPINGLIRSILDRPTQTPGFALYRAEIVPRLWFLDCTSDCRIFQDMTYPAIVAQVLQDYEIAKFEFKLLKQDYPTVEYCVQYRESALTFISRLLEHVGIFYLHEHDEHSHKLVFTDSNQFTGRLAEQPLKLAAAGASADVQAISTRTAFRPGAWSLKDYDFEGPTKFMEQNIQTDLTAALLSKHERFDFPGGYTDQSVGQWLTKLRMEEEESQFNRTLGVATVAAMLPGRRFELERDESPEAKHYLLTEVRHHAQETSYFAATERTASQYRNEFVAINASVPFRPQRLTPKSFVRGTQTAMVVSTTPNDPIQVDQYGRVKVYFYWDRRGNPNSGATSCWVRVSQLSTGAGFGSVATPHAGQEVIVDFLEGDPDRPLIVGRVHNSDKMPPLDVPSDKNKTITRDHGSNKIVMQGASGQQHINVSSPRSVNLIATKQNAQPLSAAATTTTPPPPSGGNYYFYADVTTSTTATGTIATILTSSPEITIPSYQDSDGLAMLYNSWYDIPPTAAQTAADSVLYGGTEGLNSASANKMNSLSLGNANTWIYGNANTWVNGDSYSQFNNDVYTVVGGHENGANTVTAVMSTVLYGDNKSYVYGNNDSITLGASETLTMGPAETLNIGTALSINASASAALNFAASFTYNVAAQMATNVGPQLTNNIGFNATVGTASTDDYGTHISDKISHIQTAAIKSLATGLFAVL
jgi:type VI secretion system secreted protein VgrG